MSKLISIGNIIDYTWDHFTTHFKVLMNITMWLFLVALLTIILNIATPLDFTGLINETGAIPDLKASELIFGILQAIVVSIVGPVVGVWILLTILQAARLQQSKKSVDVKAIGRNSWSMFISYVWIAFLKGLTILVPLFLIVPGVVLLIYNTVGPQIPWLSGIGMLVTFLAVILSLCLVVYAGVVFHFAEYRLVFEGTRGTNAMRESKRLVHGRFFSTLVRIIIPKVVFIIPVVIIQVLLVFLIALLIPSVAGLGASAFVKISQTMENIISTTLAVLSTPLFILADYYIYDSLRKTE